MNPVVPVTLPAPVPGKGLEPPTLVLPAALERAGLIGEMAAGIAHDFRNVLGVIGAAIHLAEAASGQAAKSAIFLKAARDGVERGSRLASRLLALAQARQGEPRSTDLSRLTKELLPFLGYAAGPGVAVRADLQAEAAPCTVDPSQFGTALLNLVVNARDAMAGEGEIRIRTDRLSANAARPRHFFRLRVADSGIGMSDEVAARIFDPWFTTKGESGTGLGLPQVHRMIAAARGGIGLFSAPDRGTWFDLFFPIDEEPPPGHRTGGEPPRWVNDGLYPGPARFWP